MFDFFKRKKKEESNVTEANVSQELYAVADGEFVAIDAINDPVFSQKMMGDGFGVNPENDAVYAPISGTVMSIFPTKHAVYIKTETNLEVLVHMGIDTVELDGGPFTLKVEEGQHVGKGDQIAEIDLAALEQAGKEKTVVVIFTNMNEVKDLHLEVSGSVAAGDQVGTVEANK